MPAVYTSLSPAPPCILRSSAVDNISSLPSTVEGKIFPLLPVFFSQETGATLIYALCATRLCCYGRLCATRLCCVLLDFVTRLCATRLCCFVATNPHTVELTGLLVASIHFFLNFFVLFFCRNLLIRFTDYLISILKYFLPAVKAF